MKAYIKEICLSGFVTEGDNLRNCSKRWDALYKEIVRGLEDKDYDSLPPAELILLGTEEALALDF